MLMELTGTAALVVAAAAAAAAAATVCHSAFLRLGRDGSPSTRQTLTPTARHTN